MYKIEDDRKFYLYTRSSNTTAIFNNIEELILHFQNNNYEDKWFTAHRYNKILDHYGVTFKDTEIEIKYERKEDDLGVNVIKIIKPKEYVVYDSTGKFINMFNYRKQIFDKEYHEYLKRKYKKPLRTRGYWYHKWGNYDHPHEFRVDPLPHQGNISHKRKRKVHAPRYIGKFRQSQYKPQYNRKKELVRFRDLFYDYWDYGDWRNKPIRCWKNQSKRRRQWK